MSSNSSEENVKEERFYESLDRILSSSASSSSCPSDDEGCGASTQGKGVFRAKSRRFSIAAAMASMYDVWVGQPDSVEERRRRLLRPLGLNGDKALVRLNSSSMMVAAASLAAQVCTGKDSEIDRSENSVDLTHCNPPPSLLSPFSRVTCTSNSNNSVSFGVENPVSVHDSHSNIVDKIRESSTKHLCDEFDRRAGERAVEIGILKSNSSSFVKNFNSEIDGNHHGISRNWDLFRTIRNLDNGKEFVINESEEDGIWNNKIREVGTDKQLTIEEFEMSVGHSPIVQELMRRQNVEENRNDYSKWNGHYNVRRKQKRGWLKSIKNIANSMTGYRERRIRDERDSSSDKGRRSSSATDDGQDVTFLSSERIKVRQYGKAYKELTALHMNQEIRAHNGSIWTIKFSLDGRFLASAGEDCVIHVWQVLDSGKKTCSLVDRLDERSLHPCLVSNGSQRQHFSSSNAEGDLEKKRMWKSRNAQKSISFDHTRIRDNMFALSEKPTCSFCGHLGDVLDLSWSKSQYLLSSSMDKTVRLWHMSSKSCLKTFEHSDYVTCIQFNPVDDRYFISGSLDSKVRIWSIPDGKVVAWEDLHEMVTAACYTPDGKAAYVGSHKGSCRIYNTSDNKLLETDQVNLRINKKKSRGKKITGFQFGPGSSKVLITSADSRIRVIDGIDLVQKFKGFRNTSSQITASLTANRKFVVSASEDSHVYVWRYNDLTSNRGTGVTVTQAYEHFFCQRVSVAIPWCNSGSRLMQEISSMPKPCQPLVEHSRQHEVACTTNSNGVNFSDKFSATWPEEKLLVSSMNKKNSYIEGFFCPGQLENCSAWGMVIVTAGLGGDIKTFQNFGVPMKL